jgi:hypothetical protein
MVGDINGIVLSKTLQLMKGKIKTQRKPKPREGGVSEINHETKRTKGAQ